MSMNFSNDIQGFNVDFNLNAIKDYNNYLQRHDAFEFDSEATAFSQALETASKSAPLRDKNDPIGMGNFMDKMSMGVGNALDAVNRNKLEADRLQEDLAQGGPTSIHDAMIAAEKAELSMNMAIQIRNRIINAYTEINSMAL